MKGNLYQSGEKWFVTWSAMTSIGLGVDMLEVDESDYENELIDGNEVDFRIVASRAKLIDSPHPGLEERLTLIEKKLDRILQLLGQF